MIGLSFGLGRVAIGCGTACGVVALALPWAIPVFVVVVLIPALVLVRQALLRRQCPDDTVEWYPPGLLVAWLGICAVGLMVVGAVILPVGGGSLEDEARRYVTLFVEQVVAAAPADVKKSAIALWSATLPAMLAGAWLIMAALNGVLAQWTVVKAGHALRPTPRYSGLELPLWMLGALAFTAAIGAAAGGTAGYLGRNAAIVLLVPHAFEGLAVVHRVLRRRQNAAMLLAFFYVSFFALLGWALMAVAGLGVVSHLTRLRRRRAGSSQEEK